ncbi:MAG: DNA repair protein RadC [Cyanobacteria bacterium]|nr:DNA repair protein RadC [Cyanobacteriota bacterium]
MPYSLRIIDLPPTERPRERLMELGPQSLSNAELLAILLGTGQGAGQLSAVGLGQLILQVIGGRDREPLAALRDVSLAELTAIHGVGPAKGTTILAAIELGKRMACVRPLEKTTIDSPELAAAALSQTLMWSPQERFAVLMLDVKHRLLNTQLISIGTATETLAHPREIFRETIRQGATRCIVAHNHPSGSVEPSVEDLDLTRTLLQCGQLLDLPVLDHLIVGQGNHYSLRQNTGLWEEYPQGG